MSSIIPDSTAADDGVSSSAAQSSAEGPAHPPLSEAFRVWLKVASLSFGGPARQIAVMPSVGWFALALSVAAAVAVFRFEAGMLPTLAGCCAAGIILFLAALLA